jgi:hypothetical protein
MLSGEGSFEGRSFGVEGSLPAAPPCIARGETLHLVSLVPEYMFVQTAGKPDAQKTRQAADDAGAVASPLARNREDIGMLRLRGIALRSLLFRSA